MTRGPAAQRDPVAVARTLEQVAVLVASGVPSPRAWMLVGGRPDADTPAWCDVRAVLDVADRTGAPSAVALRSLASAMRRSAAADRAVRVALAGPRTSARVVLALPVFGLGLGSTWGPDALGVLLTRPLGWVCCILAVGLVVAGQRWARRLVRSATPDGHVPGIVLDAWAVALSGGGPWSAAEQTVHAALAVTGRPQDDSREAAEAERVRAVLDLARRAGVPAAAMLRAAAEDVRDDAAAAGLAAAERLAVRLVLPLGVCVLPAFVLVGVVPVVVGVLSSTVGGLR
ncbi:hypothetical protein [Curtobacterium sp. MCSS17_007]|uniref:type II secretion system F family protein n=1 Tax=Curtobacterium sp. MCSS17_007 TaxID=2175646 RepID=UPI000DA87EED|nr:hypothetical protein [Curtobacterium sp. MCSS17_007]WIE74716.1 hypothetical protein DEJ22_010595 [Curtobacterium sp. MCSS17_007]